MFNKDNMWEAWNKPFSSAVKIYFFCWIQGSGNSSLNLLNLLCSENDTLTRIIPKISVLEWELSGQMRSKFGKVVSEFSLLYTHHLNMTFIPKGKLNHAIQSRKIWFYKYSLSPGRSGDSDTIDFKRSEHLFLVALAIGVCLAWKGERLFGLQLPYAQQLPAPCVWPLSPPQSTDQGHMNVQITWITSAPSQ